MPDALGVSPTFDINAAYTPTDTTELCLLMRKYGSDKGLGRHNYTTLYHAVFALTFRRVDLPNPLNGFDDRVLLVYER